MTTSMLTNDWTEFDPRAYLEEYYADIGAENEALLKFFVHAFEDVPSNGTLLDFGGGPTIYPLIAAAKKVKEIHFSDYLESNLSEVRKWLLAEDSAFDWSMFIQRTLEIEKNGPCSATERAQRATEIRSRITRLIHVDASLPSPLEHGSQLYDIIVSNFCAESATDDRQQWYVFLHNIVSLLKPNGKLILCTLKGATQYSVGEKVFPAVNIAEPDLAEALVASGCNAQGLVIQSVPADRPTRHYHGLMFAVAEKEHGATARERYDRAA